MLAYGNFLISKFLIGKLRNPVFGLGGLWSPDYSDLFFVYFTLY